MPLCNTNQGEVFFEAAGTGTPLVLLHADCASGIEYASVVRWLSQQFQVIILDHPGCGRSPRRAFSDEYYEENAKAALDVLKRVSSQAAWVVGNGGGAVSALWMSILAPARVRGVVADSFVEFLDPLDVQKDLQAHRQPTPEMIAFWREMNGEDWTTVVNQLDPLLLGLSEGKRSLFDWRLEDVPCPVLATGSRGDHLFSDLPRRLLSAVEQVPNAKLILYGSGGHPAMWSQADSFWSDALAFIKAQKIPS